LYVLDLDISVEDFTKWHVPVWASE